MTKQVSVKIWGGVGASTRPDFQKRLANLEPIGPGKTIMAAVVLLVAEAGHGSGFCHLVGPPL